MKASYKVDDVWDDQGGLDVFFLELGQVCVGFVEVGNGKEVD